MDIHVLHRQRMGIRAIAKQMQVSRNTVRRYLRDQAQTPRYAARAKKPSLLEPFTPYLKKLIAAAHPHWIPAVVLYREIQAQGYQDKDGMIRNYVRAFKQVDTFRFMQGFPNYGVWENLDQ